MHLTRPLLALCVRGLARETIQVLYTFKFKFSPGENFCLPFYNFIHKFLCSENSDTLNFACTVVSARTYTHSTYQQPAIFTHYFLEGNSRDWRNIYSNARYKPLVKILAIENFVVYGITNSALCCCNACPCLLTCTHRT